MSFFFLDPFIMLSLLLNKSTPTFDFPSLYEKCAECHEYMDEYKLIFLENS